jgi:hypothetical protein
MNELFLHWVIFATFAAFITAIVFNKKNLIEHYILWLFFPVAIFILVIGFLLVVASTYSPLQHDKFIAMLQDSIKKYFKSIFK